MFSARTALSSRRNELVALYGSRWNMEAAGCAVSDIEQRKRGWLPAEKLFVSSLVC